MARWRGIIPAYRVEIKIQFDFALTLLPTREPLRDYLFFNLEKPLISFKVKMHIHTLSRVTTFIDPSKHRVVFINSDFIECYSRNKATIFHCVSRPLFWFMTQKFGHLVCTQGRYPLTLSCSSFASSPMVPSNNRRGSSASSVVREHTWCKQFRSWSWNITNREISYV